MAQLHRLHARHGQAVIGQQELEAALQAFVKFFTQRAAGRHLADRACTDEFQRQLAHRMGQQFAQLGRADGAGRGHEVARKGRNVLDFDADREAHRNRKLLAGEDVVKVEWHRQRRGARNEDFRVLVAQQMVQAREETFEFVFALRHLGRLVALQDEAPRRGGHAQRLDEQPG